VFLQRAPFFVVPLHCLDEQLVVVGGLVVVVGGVDVDLVISVFLLPISSKP
jgi:hypothetical protein